MSKFVRKNPLNKDNLKTLLGQAKSLNKEKVALEYLVKTELFELFPFPIISILSSFFFKSPPNKPPKFKDM